jgi:hypothetical protein
VPSRRRDTELVMSCSARSIYVAIEVTPKSKATVYTMRRIRR